MPWFCLSRWQSGPTMGVDVLRLRPCSDGLNGDMPLGSAEAHVANKVSPLANRKSNICNCLFWEQVQHIAGKQTMLALSLGGLEWHVQACCIILIWLFIPITEADAANTT